MNDNLDKIEGPRHAAAVSLLNDLMLLLGNMERNGLDTIGCDGQRVYQQWFWANECAKVLGVVEPFREGVKRQG